MPARERWLAVEGLPVHFHEAGAGPPVVVVHGLGLSGAFWRPHFPAFAAAGLRIVAPDLPGFGRSRRRRLLGETVEETADWLLAFADTLGLERPGWLGHSLAAQAVLDLAARRPARAGALVLATPTGAPGRLRRARQAWSFLRDVGREPIRLFAPVLRDYLRASIPAFLGTWLKAARDRPERKAGRVLCPTLIVAGRDDPLVPRPFLSELRRRIGNARVETLPAAAHGVFEAGAFDRLATSFLREALRR